VLFLREARLINRYEYTPDDSGTEAVTIYYANYVSLVDADLSGADLENVRLNSDTQQEPVSLRRANLYDAKLSDANLIYADLSGANLGWADLSDANLWGADLSGANLSRANLRGANLREANLNGAEGITEGQLERQANYLEGATMPNGREYS